LIWVVAAPTALTASTTHRAACAPTIWA
jgi:hypothetical protein